jgi:hypothetical protein
VEGAVAALDEDVSELLSALLATEMAPRARDAIAAVLAEEEGGREDLGGAGDERSRWAQLDIADRMISGGIKLEIIASGRLRELAPKFGLEDITIAPAGGGEAPTLAGPSLIGRGREEALHAFLQTWEEVVREIRLRWELDGGQ